MKAMLVRHFFYKVLFFLKLAILGVLGLLGLFGAYYMKGMEAAAQDVGAVDSQEETESGEDVSGDSDSPEDTGEAADNDENKEDPAAESPEDIFDVEVKALTQSFWDQSVTVQFWVQSSVDSSKAQVRWQIPRHLKVEGETDVWFKLEADQPLYFEITVTPEQAGSYTVVTEVEAWRYDANYVDSTALELEFDQNLELIPQTPEYKQAKELWFIGRIVGVIVAIALAAFLVWLFAKKFQDWLAAD